MRWLEYDRFLLGWPIFRDYVLVSGEGNTGNPIALLEDDPGCTITETKRQVFRWHIFLLEGELG